MAVLYPHAHAQVHVEWTLGASIWAPRVSTCDARAFYDTHEVREARFSAVWKRVVGLGLGKFIQRSFAPPPALKRSKSSKSVTAVTGAGGVDGDGGGGDAEGGGGGDAGEAGGGDGDGGTGDDAPSATVDSSAGAGNSALSEEEKIDAVRASFWTHRHALFAIFDLYAPRLTFAIFTAIYRIACMPMCYL